MLAPPAFKPLFQADATLSLSPQEIKMLLIKLVLLRVSPPLINSLLPTMLTIPFLECQEVLLTPFFSLVSKRDKKEPLPIEWNNSGEMELTPVSTRTGSVVSLEDSSSKVVFTTVHHSRTSLRKNSKMLKCKERLILVSLMSLMDPTRISPNKTSLAEPT